MKRVSSLVWFTEIIPYINGYGIVPYITQPTRVSFIALHSWISRETFFHGSQIHFCLPRTPQPFTSFDVARTHGIYLGKNARFFFCMMKFVWFLRTGPMNFIIHFLTTPVLNMKQYKFKKSQRVLSLKLGTPMCTSMPRRPKPIGRKFRRKPTNQPTSLIACG